MISDADLLQANAALITGIFIFLTLAPVSKSVTIAVFEKRHTLAFTLGTLAILVLSVMYLINPGYENLEVAKYLFIAGLFGIISIIVSILARLHT